MLNTQNRCDSEKISFLKYVQIHDHCTLIGILKHRYDKTSHLKYISLPESNATWSV